MQKNVCYRIKLFLASNESKSSWKTVNEVMGKTTDSLSIHEIEGSRIFRRMTHRRGTVHRKKKKS